MRYVMATIAASVLFSASAAAEKLRIVISNDDGLTANVVALYSALEADGHDVVVSVPCQNQSGMSGALKLPSRSEPLSEACLNNAAEPGAPPAGKATLEGLPGDDFYYVEGTPVMALMYGLDVVSHERWGSDPDLVLSGPNAGQNVGSVILNSGTVGNAQHAAARGISTIALSAGSRTKAPPLSPGEGSLTVATLSVTLVNALNDLAADKALLPDGLALNVNFPDAPDNAEWRETKIGTYAAYKLRYVQNVAENATPIMLAMAEAEDTPLPDQPGITFDFNRSPPTEEQLNDEAVVYRKHIAVSPMYAGYGQRDHEAWDINALLAELAGEAEEEAE
ncbi:MAG: 5'/3'-nucleotidase SurE [Henriciella sp.]